MENYNAKTQPYSLEATFFGKVMGLFSMAILTSTAGAYIAYSYFLNMFFENPAIMYVAFAVELGLIFTSRTWSKKEPLNRVLFGLFAFVTGATLAPLLAVVLQLDEGGAMLTKALLATGAMFSATALIGWTTQKDLSGIGGFAFMALIGMIIVSVIGIFVPWSNTFEMIFSGIGVIIFSAFTAYDFQKIKKMPNDSYINAALMLYLDIFNMFIFILRLILAFNSRD